MAMTTDDLSTSPVILKKRSVSREYRVHSHSQSVDKSVIDDLRLSRTLTARDRSPPKSAKVLTKTEPIQYKRCRSQQRGVLPSSPSKLERQSTTITYQTRLPTFTTLTNDDEQRRTSDFRRRQIYALNHLMRNLEQERFRQFCKLHNIGTENTINSNDDTNKDSST